MWCAARQAVPAGLRALGPVCALQRLCRLSISTGRAEILHEGSYCMCLLVYKFSRLEVDFVVCSNAYSARILLTLGPGSAVQRLYRVEICAGRVEIWHESRSSIHLPVCKISWPEVHLVVCGGACSVGGWCVHSTESACVATFGLLLNFRHKTIILSSS